MEGEVGIGRATIENELVPLSALQHFVYCPRQCALIHLEQIWEENLFTVEGKLQHNRVDGQGKGVLQYAPTEVRGDVRRAFAVRLKSDQLGLVGKADVVEFHRLAERDSGGVSITGVPGRWRPFPVEHKRGRPKDEDCDKVQLCAQALCLEEMLNTRIESGALFYGKTRRRHDVLFDNSLRDRTKQTVESVRTLLREGVTPRPRYSGKCDRCSLFQQCLPKQLDSHPAVSKYIDWMLAE